MPSEFDWMDDVHFMGDDGELIDIDAVDISEPSEDPDDEEVADG